MQRTSIINKHVFQFKDKKYFFNVDHDSTRLYLNVFQQKGAPIICERFSPLFNQIMNILSDRYSSSLSKSLNTEEQLISEKARREYKIDFDTSGIENEIDLFAREDFRCYSDINVAKRIYSYIKYHHPDAIFIEYDGYFFVSKNVKGHEGVKKRLLLYGDEMRTKLKELEKVIDKLSYAILD
ncbi:hypothetical protein [Brevibacillus laterosporus]|uniref:hypothetical protein n=1 Tax=Brevibacillus laterosporus TaxID=1465 RepID=UPI002E1EBAF2|nr:hypothetical protein [Brevibacillus laterosporus]MED1667195.1 hypothetical protein [Brevibacillus laterosporus]MED1719737.1 hypothetical protein [Brevibacillus laterosporus]